MTLEQLDLPNLKVPREGVYSCGQPAPGQLESLRDQGVKTIINLRGPGEQDWDERRSVEELGMAYHAIPIAGPGDINVENARRLSQIIEDAASRPVLVHCGSGNRVGALYALKAFHCDECAAEDAVNAGRDAGMTQLEPLVRQRLDCT